MAIFDAEAADLRFQGLLEAAPDAIVCVDADGRIVLVNGQTEQLFGYEGCQLVDEQFELLVPDGQRAIQTAGRRSYPIDPKSRPVDAGIELAGRRSDGTEFPAEMSLGAVECDDRLLMVATIRDVTDRKRLEAKFRGLLEAAPDAIVGVDRDGRIALANAQAERLFGYTREELIGQEVEILVPEAARGIHRGERSGFFAHPAPRPMGAGMELAGLRKDGSEFAAEIALSVIETDDGVLVSAAIRDITERLEAHAERERLRAEAERQTLERQLQQAQRLESLGRLAGGVAHDFNNLLGVILNYASFVSQEVDAHASALGAPWDAVRGDLAEIEKAAERAVKLTHQLLAFGRREVAHPVVLSVNDVIRDIERLLKRTLGEHIELVTNLADDVWAVLADPGQLEQVLVNLAINARDVMPAGGELVLESQNVAVDEEYAARRPAVSAGRYVRVRVSDTGCGMERDVVERAFEPFFTTKPKGEGSGLGLATVFGIVKQAEGDVEIYSEPGLGTTFSILLPASDAPATARRDPVRDVAGAGAETVLVVEDESAMRELTRRILARNGYNVIVAEGGWEAIRAALEHTGSIDVLITDVVMPKMLGKEVAERVAAVRSGLRVLFMSGYARPVLTSQGTLEPGVALVEKPFSESQLLAKVRAVLDGREQAPAGT